MKIRDLKITYNTLSELDYPVPADLLVHLAGQIRDTETRTRERKVSRMTEEQLIRLEAKQKRTLRIYTDDGRWIQKRTTEETFRQAIREIGPEHVAALQLRSGRRDLLLCDPTLSRRRIPKYAFLQPGFFLLTGTTVEQKFDFLTRIDQLLRLNWDIEFL